MLLLVLLVLGVDRDLEKLHKVGLLCDTLYCDIWYMTLDGVNKKTLLAIGQLVLGVDRERDDLFCLYDRGYIFCM